MWRHGTLNFMAGHAIANALCYVLIALIHAELLTLKQLL